MTRGRSVRQWRWLRLRRDAGHRARRYVAVVTVAVLVAALPAHAPARAAEPSRPEGAQRYASVPGRVASATPPAPDPAEAAARATRPAPVWPAAGVTDVTVPSTPTKAAQVPAGTLPIRLGRPAKADGAAAPASFRVELMPRQAAERAGVGGLLLRVGRTDRAKAAGAVTVTVSYAAFRTAFGGDWDSRLRLLALPDCALTTPHLDGCAGTPLPSRNNLRNGTVTADVNAAPVGARPPGRDGPVGLGTLLALAAGPSSGSGDLGATTLAASSTWGHTGATGGFTWAYPMRVPPAVGGPGPQVALSYASQSVDGRHAASNNQPGWIGEGFSYEPGYIERRYRPCAQDMDGDANNSTETGDQCWATDNAVLSLNGTSVELLKDSDELWHPVNDNGSRIERPTGGGNGDVDGQYWKLTAPDGTRYYFGRNHLAGWTGGKPETNSVLTVPVAGNHPNEPCHKAAFADSFCTRAWRWHLDYIEDPSGNTSSLWYARTSNYYAKNKQPKGQVPYHRDGYPVRIDYGTNNRGGPDTVYTATKAPAQVAFGVSDRCLANCATRNETTWPDTPWDQECTSTGSCFNAAPTFWSSKRLTTVTTRVWNAATAAYQDVDSWTLRQSFPDPGDGTRAGLWLAGIIHRGLRGAAITLPEVTFAGIQMNNRVDPRGGDFAPAMNWWRIASVRTEAGGEIAIAYSQRECVRGGVMPTSTDDNTRRCYPAKWTPQGFIDPILDYFHKYVVTEIQQIDHTGGAPASKISYLYENPEDQPLWHYDTDDGIIDPKLKTWGQWRGYPYVVTKVGEGSGQQVSRTLYFRGMHGDKTGGGTRTVNVAGLEGGPVPDLEHYAGVPREQITYLNGQVLTASVTTPWQSDATVTRTIHGSTVESRYTGASRVDVRYALDGGKWLRSRSDTVYDDRARILKVHRFGDLTDPDDDECETNEYVPNTHESVWILNSVKHTRNWVGNCGAAPTSADQIIADMRLSYDQQAYNVAPTKGLVSRIERMSAWNNGNPTYQEIGAYKHDARGRTVQSKDITNEWTSMSFSPDDGPVNQVTTTNPLGWTSTVTLDPAWGAVTKESDANGRVTEATYDALGRRTAVWLPDQSRGTNTACANTCNTEYQYQISKSSPNAVITKSLNANGAYLTSYALYDGLLRPRQTQGPAVGGGRIVADTFYDSVGRPWKTNPGYYNSGAPGTGLFLTVDADVPTQVRRLFDTAGRTTDTILLSEGVEKWRTHQAYHGDHIDTTPPDGGTATTVYTDPKGRPSRLLQYHAPTPSGTADETTYRYFPTGQLKEVVDPSGNTWSYEYDGLGRMKHAVDPDKGASSYTYNSFDQLTTTRDEARGITLAHTYDRLGRPTTLRDDSPTGPKRVEWTYDLPAKGLTSSVSRWIGTNEYKVELVTVDLRYRPTQTRITIPPAEGGLAGSYAFRTSYKPDGSPNTVSLPAAGNLSAETLTYTYDSTLGLPKTLKTNSSGGTHYVTDAGYTNFAEPSFINRSRALTGSGFVQSKQEYDRATHRLARRAILKSTGAAYIADTNYEYDDAGNLVKIDDNPLGGSRDTQCFTYDHLRRLTEAWTPASADCSTAPASTPMGGPAPYWQTWDFGTPTDPVGRTGSRLKETDHLTPSGPLTTEYSYPPQGQTGAKPHQLNGYTVKNAAGQTVKTASYTYDPAGNAKTRPGPNGQQSLTWDPEGHLESVSDSSGTTSYIYDGAGNRLLAKSASGATLYLPGTQIELNGTVASATRYYTFNGETVAQRTGTGVTWLCGDQQGTGQVAVSSDSTQTVIQRRQTPYGEPRGANPAWVNKKGFVGGDLDPTGLVHLGAREYDPDIGRFISVDPVIDTGNPQQMHGYAYAGNNPTTASDPSGLSFDFGDFLEGVLEGFLDALNFWKMAKATWKLITHPDEAWKGLKGEADKWTEKTGNPIVGWACALSGVCALWDACVANPQARECGKEIGAALADVVVTLITSGAAGLAKKGAEMITRIAEKYGLKIPGLNGKNDGPSSPDTDSPPVDKTPEPEKPPGDGGPDRTPTPDDDKKGGGKDRDPNAGGDKQGGGRSGGGRSGGGKPGCRHSFAPTTPVAMADGTSKPIKDVRDGDQVLATDPATGETTAKTVVDTHRNVDTDLTDVVVLVPGTPSITIVHTTQHHTFWSKTDGSWREAADLRPGNELRTLDGRDAVVVLIVNRHGRRVMRDLTVADIHTYYVLAGNTPVLVHNCGTGNISDKVMDEHILPRHDANHANAWQWAEKSKFEDWVTPDHIRNWAKLAMGKPMDNMNLGTGTAHRHVLDIKSRHPIGYDAGGNGLHSVAVWVKNGEVESVHPY